MSERSKQLKDKKNRGIDELKQALQMKDSSKSQLELLQLDEDDAVYDMYNEEDYEKLVESRRKGVDFVVDDEGHGYYDDGEEHVGVAEDAYERRKRLKDNLDESDSKLAKKVRKAVEATSSSQKNTIMGFVKPMASASQMVSKKMTSDSVLDIDSLMNDMNRKDSKANVNTKFSTNSQHFPLRRTFPVTTTFRPIRPLAPSIHTSHYENNVAHDDDHPQQDVDYGGDNDENQAHVANEVTQKKHVTFDTMLTPSQKGDSSMGNSSVVSPGEVEAVQRVSLSKASKKLSFAEPAKPVVDTTFKPSLRDNVDSLGLSDIMGSVSSSQESAASRPGAIDPKLWLHRRDINKEEGMDVDIDIDAAQTDPAVVSKHVSEEYVNMFWLDACEANGVVYLFGKVPVQDSESGSHVTFVSCCVAVHGCVRNLFALPRATGAFKEDGSPIRANMAEVYQEINQLLVPNIIPRTEGQNFRGKPVKRKYAFEDGEVPREETEYLKIVYSGKHPTPSQQHCNGGKFYEKIFGTSSSPLELFLLKRELMGPCWISIRHPRMGSDTLSWCKINIAIEDPKFVHKLPRSEAPSSPPLTSFCVSMKTVLNPSTHLHEIVSLSGLIHTKVECDKDTDIDPKTMKRFTFIRPLGNTCGSNYPQAFPHDLQNEIKKSNANGILQTFTNERALLSAFFARVQQEDPDIFASHNLFGFEFDVLLSRALVNKIGEWSRLGRLRRLKTPKNINDKDITSGRILCDTYKAAKEFLRETNYSLTSLSASQLNVERAEVDPVDIPKYFFNSSDIMKVANHTACDALLVQRLVLKLQIIPLTKQLTNLSGNLWTRTMRGARAERIEYLLLHEFHAQKYILPEKKQFDNGHSSNGKKGGNRPQIVDGEDAGDDEMKVGGTSRNKAKAAYAGGLVLEPKKGLYDTYILLLDFNSLYPSLIQEYNLCFTTINWTKYMHDAKDKEASAMVSEKTKKVLKGGKKTVIKSESGNLEEDGDGHVEEEDDAGGESDDDEHLSSKALPPLPDPSTQQGILPRVIRALVDRRREVKNLLKKERDPAQRQTLDIRQKALKLTANSMYGCLGFAFSRFYARPIAALVTSMGREALMRTVDQARNQFGLDVIYGDTDSLMINTNSRDLDAVKKLGYEVKSAVNKLYKSLELDIDGIFKSMLLLKKKKYAAVTIKEVDGQVLYEKEMKGLDLVRRDWCPLSKNAGKYVVEQILSGNTREDIVLAIHEYLTDLSKRIRSREIDLAEFVVTKGLNKNPHDYPDTKGQPHLQVALAMLKANKPVNIGDHIPYVICAQNSETLEATMRAHHPDEVIRNPDALTLDFEWYLSNQILPPISRLCEPIEGTSTAALSQCLGLDASKYARNTVIDNCLEDEDWGFTPQCKMEDSERFKDCAKLHCKCLSCKEDFEFLGVSGGNRLNCGKCGAIFLGRATAQDCYAYLSNKVTLMIRDFLKQYYDCWFVCDDPTCHRRTMQQPTKGLSCIGDCHGKLIQEYTDAQLHNQLKYLESLFDPKRKSKGNDIKNELATTKRSTNDDDEVFRLLNAHLANTIKNSAYNWVRPSIWTAVFGRLTVK